MPRTVQGVRSARIGARRRDRGRGRRRVAAASLARLRRLVRLVGLSPCRGRGRPSSRSLGPVARARRSSRPTTTAPRSRPSASRTGPSTPGPRRARRIQSATSASQRARPELGLDQVDPPAAARPAVEQAVAGRSPCAAPGCVPAMNQAVGRRPRPRPGLAAGPGVDGRLDDALRPLELRRPASRSCSRARRRATAARPRSARSPGSFDARVRVVAVAHPDADGEAGPVRRPAARGSRTSRGRGRRSRCRS